MIHLDSSLLIDLRRETARERPGPAWEVMESINESELLAVSVHAVGELRTGAELCRKPLVEHEDLDRLLEGLLIVFPDGRFPPLFGRVRAALHRTGRPMPTMDLLIATAALIDDAPLITRNVKDFSRVPGLRVIGY